MTHAIPPQELVGRGRGVMCLLKQFLLFVGTVTILTLLQIFMLSVRLGISRQTQAQGTQTQAAAGSARGPLIGNHGRSPPATRASMGGQGERVTDAVASLSKWGDVIETKGYSCRDELDSLMGVSASVRASNCTDADCHSFTCANFFRDPPKEKPFFDKARAYMKKTTRQTALRDEAFVELAKDCDVFRQQRGYHVQPVSAEEADYPIAFTVLMHTNLEQVEKMFRAIYRPQNVYCFHVDAKAPETLREGLRALVSCFDNAFVASKLERIVYAGFSRLQADVNCMEDLLAHPVRWRYLLNVAGLAFPLMTNAELVKLLRIYNGANDIEGMRKRVLRSRIDNEWTEASGVIKTTGKKNPEPPDDIRISRGSAYGIFSRDFVHFVLNDSKARHLLEWSRLTYSPDEHYWATLHHTLSNPHLHTPGGYSGMPDDKPWLASYSAWGDRDPCQGQWKRGVCIFGIGDLPNLQKRKEAFANKLYMDFEPLALECMENWIEYKTRCPKPFDESYYKTLPFVKSRRKLW